MNSIKLLHTADIHIGARESYLDAVSAERRTETLLTFENTVRIARENGVRLFLIAGDAFDSNRIESSLADGFFSCIENAGDIHFVFCAGNHDPLSAESPFLCRKTPENLHIIPAHDSCITLDDIGVRVYGCSFNSVYKKGEERFSVIPPNDGIINIMCIHGELSHGLSSDYNSVTEDFIKNSGMDYVALGHIHKRTEVMRTGSTYFAYCGCPEGHGFDETGEKGVYIGTVSKGECKIDFVPTAKRMYICERIDITDADGISEKVLTVLNQKYGSGFKNNLYKIVLVGGIAEGTEINTSEILARISAQVYFAKLRDETHTEADFDAISREKSLKGVFVKKMLERISAAEETEKKRLYAALQLGIRAFDTEVAYNEDK